MCSSENCAALTEKRGLREEQCGAEWGEREGGQQSLWAEAAGQAVHQTASLESRVGGEGTDGIAVREGTGAQQ